MSHSKLTRRIKTPKSFVSHIQPYKKPAGEPMDLNSQFSEQILNNFPILFGREIEITFNGTDRSINIQHGLNRAYKGGFVVGVSAVNTRVYIITPEEAAEDIDIVRFVRIEQSSAKAQTVRFWIY